MKRLLSMALACALFCAVMAPAALAEDTFAPQTLSDEETISETAPETAPAQSPDAAGTSAVQPESLSDTAESVTGQGSTPETAPEAAANAGGIRVYLNAAGGELEDYEIWVSYGGYYGDLPTPSREHYRFEGWYDPAGGRVDGGTRVARRSEHTLTAHWRKVEEAKVEFDARGGSVNPTSRWYAYNERYNDLPTPSRNGCKFVGWFTDANGGNLVTGNSTVDRKGTYTLYAHWNVVVHFDGNGGNAAVSTREFPVGGTYESLSADVSRAGNTFVGWFDAPVNGNRRENGGQLVMQSEHTLYAHWQVTDGGPIRDYVRNLYETLLRREPDAGGLLNNVNALVYHKQTAASVAAGLLFSPEGQSKGLCNKHFVTALYTGLLCRQPDAPGLDGYVNRLKAGTSRDTIFKNFIGSPDFQTVCNANYMDMDDGKLPVYTYTATEPCIVCRDPKLNSKDFIRRLYKICLNRTNPNEKTEVEAWNNQLVNRTLTGRGLAFGFVFSDEFQRKGLSNSAFVDCLYSAFFDRSADAPGKAYWVGQLNSGIPRTRIFEGFIGSDEFTDLCNKYGILRG